MAIHKIVAKRVVAGVVLEVSVEELKVLREMVGKHTGPNYHAGVYMHNLYNCLNAAVTDAEANNG